MELCSIASGSSGNCIYAGTDDCHLLVDAGISGKRIEAGLNEIGLKTCEMDGILVTHEHIDHIKGLGVVARRYGIPMYMTAGTRDWILRSKALGEVDESLFRTVKAEENFAIKDLEITPLAVSHDAAEPVAYRMRQGMKKMAVLTDLGTWDERLVAELQGLDALVLEANHDVRMLETGVYPYPLKRRIMSDRGHLSNEHSGQLLGLLLHDHFQTVMLGHLSKVNNYPELAREAVKLEIDQGEGPYRGSDFPIQVAEREKRSDMISI